MARYLGPRGKLSRRYGSQPVKTEVGAKSDNKFHIFDLELFSGTQSIQNKCKHSRPGQHGRSSSQRQSDYGTQLLEKQKVKQRYGILERPFRRFFKLALKNKGNTGVNFMQLLERRLDNVVYRMGFAKTRAEARQLVCHGAILLNNKKASIPSLLVMPDDKISIKESARNQARIKNALDNSSSSHSSFDWVQVDRNKCEGIFKTIPDRSDFAHDIKESLIVELYSR